MITLVDVLKRTESFFRTRDIPSPRLDAELILCHHLGLDRVALYLQFDRPLADEDLAPMREHVRRRGEREPLAWILGTKEFWSLELASHSGVLVPRPDSETLVSAAIGWIPETERCFIADVGAGTGAIGIAIATERPEARLFATDMSDAALACTKANVERHGLTERVAVLRGNLLEPIPTERQIDIVVSNPPYIPTADIDNLPPEIQKHEPRTALDGGTDGLDVYRALIPAAAQRAQVGILVEVGDGQSDDVASLMEDAGLVDIETTPDLTQTPRVVAGRIQQD